MKLMSPAIKAASAFAMGGAAFALANLLLARHLSTHDFGQFSLILAIALMSIPMGPLGLDAVVLRHRPGPQLKLLGLSFVVGGVGAVLIVATAALIYELDARILPVITIAIVAGSVTRLGASVYQSVERFRWSLWLTQSQNLMLLAASVAIGIWSGVTSTTVFSLYAAHWVAAAVIGWLALIRWSGIPRLSSWSVPWPELPALFGYILTFNLSTQLDKLLIPKLLDIESLATFGVLSTLVLAPFKMLQSGVGYTLIPGMKAATSHKDRQRIALHEARASALVVVLGAISGFLVAPWVADVFLAGKYELGIGLVASTVLAGTMRVVAMYV